MGKYKRKAYKQSTKELVARAQFSVYGVPTESGSSPNKEPIMSDESKMAQLKLVLAERAKATGRTVEEILQGILAYAEIQEDMAAHPTQFYIGEDNDVDFPALVEGPFFEKPDVPKTHFLYLKWFDKYLICDSNTGQVLPTNKHLQPTKNAKKQAAEDDITDGAA
jgi:hypothetical protein